MESDRPQAKKNGFLRGNPFFIAVFDLIRQSNKGSKEQLIRFHQNGAVEIRQRGKACQRHGQIKISQQIADHMPHSVLSAQRQAEHITDQSRILTGQKSTASQATSRRVMPSTSP